jgi:hypothetical protein
MKPSLKHQYQVEDLCLENVIIFVVRDYKRFGLLGQGDGEDPNNNDFMLLSLLNNIFCNIVCNTIYFRHLDFSWLKEPRLGYEDRWQISVEQVDLAMLALIHYRLHPGMLIRYLKG